MTFERRPPPGSEPIFIPRLKNTDPESDIGILHRALEDLALRLNQTTRYQGQAFDGAAPVHGSDHDMDGSDPLSEPGDPEPIGATADAGSGPGKANEDHVHADLRLTTKGDLLGYSTTAVRVPVGADNALLEAASGATPGVQWSTLQTVLLRLLTANGDLLYRNGAGAIARIPTHTSPRAAMRLSGQNDASVSVAWVPDFEPYFYGNFNDNTTTDVLHMNLDAGEFAAIRLRYAVMAYDSTDRQIETGIVHVRAVRTSGGTITSAIEVVADPQVLSSGTLAVTWTRNDDAAGNRVTLRVNANSSLAGATVHDLSFRHWDLCWNGTTPVAAFVP